MRKPFRFFHFASYLVFRACEGAVRLLPLDWAFLLGQGAGELAYRVLRKRRAVALANLRLAFGAEKSEAELRALNREHFQLLAANLVAGLKCSTMPHDKIWERVTANVPAPEDRLKIGWIALISHIGNWELFSHLGEKYREYRFGAIYQGLANPYIDAHLTGARMRSGITLFDRRREMLRSVKFLREGGVVGVLVDQGAGYAGLWTPLFGRLTSSSTFTAMLSIRTGLPVVPLSINTCGRARWRLTISDPVFPEHDDPEAMTAQINRLLEEQIRASPADWLWSHNRWKPLRPHVLFALDQRRVFFPPDCGAESVDPFRILLVPPSSAETALAAVPAIRAIKAGRPDNWVAALSTTATAGMWRDLPAVDHVVEWSGRDSIFALAGMIREAARFDVAIFLDRSWKPAAAVRLAGIPIRVGRPGGIVGRLFNQYPASIRPDISAVDDYLQIARSVGADINQPGLTNGLNDQSAVVLSSL
jgi:KDO2-lipid IV(A) lauroyltransferase